MILLVVLPHQLFYQITKEGAKEGQIFADKIFEDFDYDGVKRRCREYTLERVKQRQEKSKDLLTAVDVTNELYRLKIGK